MINLRSPVVLLAALGIGLVGMFAFAGAFVGPEAADELLSTPHRAPSWEHPAGTDALGRDLLARLARGATVSMWTGFCAAATMLAIGTLLGGLAGLRGGTIDTLTRALADAVASIPAIIGLLALGLVLGGGFAIVPLTIALVQWPAIFRAVRAEARRLRDATFTRASEAMGASPWWILRHHIIPHLAPLLAASFATSFAWAVQAEAVLGFLGLSPSDWPSLGRLMGEGASELARGFVWPVAFAGGTLFVAVASAQVLADEFARED